MAAGAGSSLRWRAPASSRGAARKALPLLLFPARADLLGCGLRKLLDHRRATCSRKCRSVAERELHGPLWPRPLRERRGWPSRQLSRAAGIGAAVDGTGHGSRRQWRARRDGPYPPHAMARVGPQPDLHRPCRGADDGKNPPPAASLIALVIPPPGFPKRCNRLRDPLRSPFVEGIAPTQTIPVDRMSLSAFSGLARPHNSVLSAHGSAPSSPTDAPEFCPRSPVASNGIAHENWACKKPSPSAPVPEQTTLAPPQTP